MTVSPLAQFAINHRNSLDYTPLLSTAVNLVYLFQKHVILPRLRWNFEDDSYSIQVWMWGHWKVFSEDYVTHLKQRSTIQQVVLWVPILGNIVVAIMDWKEKRALIKAIEQDPTTFNKAPDWLKRDPDVKSVFLRVAKIPDHIDVTTIFKYIDYFEFPEKLRQDINLTGSYILQQAKDKNCDFSRFSEHPIMKNQRWVDFFEAKLPDRIVKNRLQTPTQT